MQSSLGSHKKGKVGYRTRICSVDALTRGLIVVDGDAFELKVAGAAVHARWVDAVLLRYDLPELEPKTKCY